MKRSFLYYGEDGKIHAISPIEHSEFSHLSSMLIPMATGLEFVTGARNMEKWFVTDGPKGKQLTDIVLEVPPAKPGKRFKLPTVPANSDFIGLSCVAYLYSDILEISLPSGLKGNKLPAIKNRTLEFFLTKNNDPHALLKSFVIDLDELLTEGSIKVDMGLGGKISSLELHTNWVLSSYRFEVQRNVWRKELEVGGYKINNLVTYKPEPTINGDFDGLLVEYFPSSKTLIFNINGNPSLLEPHSNICPIFLTKVGDPTIPYFMFEIDLPALIRDSKYEVTLPSTVTGTFQICGFPLSEELIFKPPSSVSQKVIGYRPVKLLPEKFVGIVAEHHVNLHKLVLRINNNAKLDLSSSPTSSIFVTSVVDPTILYSTLEVDLRKLSTLKQVEVPLPHSIKGAFGISGFELTQNNILIKI